MKKLLIATTQEGKVKEFKAILKHLKLAIISLKDINFPKTEVKEDGLSFSQNAEMKAKFYGNKTRFLTLADDSGLIVDHLPNKLGIKTKRYAHGSDSHRSQKLLTEMRAFPLAQRKAKFISAICLFDPQTGVLKTSQGECRGTIAYKPKGRYGFGYDPIFMVDSLKKHFAELTLAEKNKISHRAKALQKIRSYLKKYEK